jgi:thioredoxin-like negative regulator of GroEL
VSRIVREASPLLLRQRLRQAAALETELRIDRDHIIPCAIPLPSKDLPIGVVRKAKPGWVELLAGETRAGLRPPDWAFLKQWYLLATAYNQGHEYLAAAKECIETAPARLREDAEMKLAEGTLSERSCSQSEKGQGGCSRAERLYRAAFAADPSMMEARLRLGKVLVEQGRTSDAITFLAPLTMADDTSVSYLARLFAGLAHERANEVDQAQRFYELAEERAATASTTMALANLAYRAGDRARARSLLVRKNAHAPDPWLGYSKGAAWNAEEYLARLRSQR